MEDVRGSDDEETYKLYKNLDPNLVIDSFGKYGRFQIMICVIANMVYFSCCVNVMIIPLVSDDSNDQNCTNSTGVYKEKEYYTFSSEFGLVCDRKSEINHASSLYLLGCLLVGPVVLQLSDIYGRRLPFLSSVFASVFANFTAAFSPNYSVFLVARFVSGITDACFFSMSSSLAAESVSTEFRNTIPIFFNFFWLTGYMSIGLLRLSIYNWRWLWAAASLPGVLALPLYYQIPESLHWLIAKQKHEEVKQYIDRVCKFNGQPMDLEECQRKSSTPPARVSRNIFDILKRRTLLTILLVNGYIHVVLSFTYFALSLFSTDLSSDKMTGFFLSGLVEIPGTIIGNTMIHYCKRKTVSFVSLTAICSSLAAAALFQRSSNWITVLSMIAKCFSVVLICNQPLFCMECSPTSVRNLILGIVGFMRDSGAVLTPYVELLNFWGSQAPLAFISALAAVASVSVFLLPETKGRQLPEDIDDIDCDRRGDHEESVGLLNDEQ